MRVVRALLLVLIAIAALVVTVAVMARFSDGPIGPFPGGKLHGTLATAPVIDWTPLLAGAAHVELEVDPTHPRSVTTSYLVHDGALYVPSMLAARKRWPQAALADDRVVVRVNGTLYPCRAVRVTDPGELRPLVRAFGGGADDDLANLSTWFFRIDQRQP